MICHLVVHKKKVAPTDPFRHGKMASTRETHCNFRNPKIARMPFKSSWCGCHLTVTPYNMLFFQKQTDPQVFFLPGIDDCCSSFVGISLTKVFHRWTFHGWKGRQCESFPGISIEIWWPKNLQVIFSNFYNILEAIFCLKKKGGVADSNMNRGRICKANSSTHFASWEGFLKQWFCWKALLNAWEQWRGALLLNQSSSEMNRNTLT